MLNTKVDQNPHPPAKRNLAPILLAAFGIILLAGIFLIIHSTSSAPEASAPAVIVPTLTSPNPVPTPMPSKQPDYLTFYSNLSGYSIDYPSSWKVVGANGMHSVFADTGNTNTEIDITREMRNYQNLINDLSAPLSGEILKIKNGKNESITYSLFMQTIGTKIRYEYISDFNPMLLRIYCDYQSSSEAERSFDKINAFIMHMILSYHPDGAALNPAVKTVPTTSAISPAINPLSSASVTPAASNPPQTVLASKINSSISVYDGKYNDYYLGLVDGSRSKLGGNGCYDDKGAFIILINNKKASNPTYDQLIRFLQQDKTDQYPYISQSKSSELYYGSAESNVDLTNVQNIIDGTAQPANPKECGDFAERLHNNAEQAGIKCGYVSIYLSNYVNGHACDAFQTTDRGLIFIDDTGMLSNEPHPSRMVKTVIINIGQNYVPASVFPESGWKNVWDSLGPVANYQVVWEGSWSNRGA
jgi:hypothetical protein